MVEIQLEGTFDNFEYFTGLATSSGTKPQICPGIPIDEAIGGLVDMSTVDSFIITFTKNLNYTEVTCIYDEDQDRFVGFESPEGETTNA